MATEDERKAAAAAIKRFPTPGHDSAASGTEIIAPMKISWKSFRNPWP